MQDLRSILTEAELGALRRFYDGGQLLRANAGAFASVYPPLAEWGRVAGDLFFESRTMAPRDRELCLIALLTHRSPGLSLANHMYWGLMEGVTVDEICQAIGLAGCYCGLPTYTQGVFTLHKALGVMKRLAAQPRPEPRVVLAALVEEFSGLSL